VKTGRPIGRAVTQDEQLASDLRMDALPAQAAVGARKIPAP
jgi:hypothetical protein